MDLKRFYVLALNPFANDHASIQNSTSNRPQHLPFNPLVQTEIMHFIEHELLHHQSASETKMA